MSDAVQVRVGDRERRAVDDRLMAAVADGVLTLAEYDERAGALWQARVRTELDVLVADLPPGEVEPASSHVTRPAPRLEGRPRPRRAIAVMSEDQLHGTVAPGQDVVGVAVMGKSVLDLRQQDLPSGTRVRAGALMGEVEVLVPDGAVVHLSGMSFMGERKVQTVQVGSGPVVHVHAVAVMGSINVRHGPVVRSSALAELAPEPRSGSAQVSRVQTSPPARRSGRLRRIGAALGGSALSIALVAGAGGVVASGTDQRVVFGSAVHQVSERDVVADGTQAVSVLFGSITVVVPDDVAVDRGGLVVFGSVDCEDACSSSGEKVAVSLRVLGGFGSVEILTQTEYDAEVGTSDRDRDRG